tara:strand:- start:30 stop:284 length:255 start_codon:yes stop_codon:yes gene_type:complete
MNNMPYEVISQIYNFDGRYIISYNNIIKQIESNIFEYNRNSLMKTNTLIFDQNIDIIDLIENDYFYDNDFYKYMLKMAKSKKLL